MFSLNAAMPGYSRFNVSVTTQSSSQFCFTDNDQKNDCSQFSFLILTFYDIQLSLTLCILIGFKIIQGFGDFYFLQYLNIADFEPYWTILVYERVFGVSLLIRYYLHDVCLACQLAITLFMYCTLSIHLLNHFHMVINSYNRFKSLTLVIQFTVIGSEKKLFLI